MWDIINQREKKPFENFKDISTRINLMPDPIRVITERIIEELQGKSKYHLFIRPPRSEEYQPSR
jgi:putative nucleotide binding protein